MIIGTVFTDDQLVALIQYLEEKSEAEYTLNEVIDELSGRRSGKSQPVTVRSLPGLSEEV